jgi:hypothetical protein
MTSTTIAMALFPTALRFGEGAELRAPLAAAVLGGVISSTLLTLVLVPVMYTLLDGLTTGTGRRLARLGGLFQRRRPVPDLLELRPAALAVPTHTNGKTHPDVVDSDAPTGTELHH